MTARNVDNLSQHFPMCMTHLHRSLRRDSHLKHFGRLQYTLFLKGIGLNLEEALVFWRGGFAKVTDDTFNKEYRYNVRHAYGDVGGDSNRRSGGYSPYSCQRILTEHAPGSGDAHGCPYRHFSPENLGSLLRASGVTDHAVLQGVKTDTEGQKFHMACNRSVLPLFLYLSDGATPINCITTTATKTNTNLLRYYSVFEHLHKTELKRARDAGVMTAAQLETIVHPNEYFKRSYVLKNMENDKAKKKGGVDVKMEG